MIQNTTVELLTATPTSTQIALDVRISILGQLGGLANALAIQDNHAFLGLGPRLLVIDISNPKTPNLLGKSEILAGPIQSITLINQFAYLILEGFGLQVIDVSTPVNPSNLALLKITGANTVTIANNYAYVTTGYSCTSSLGGDTGCQGDLHIIDISDLANPIEAGSINIGGWGSSIIVLDNYAYVVAGNGQNFKEGLRVVSILDPTNPELVNSLELENIYGSNVAIVATNHYAYIVGDAYLWVIDINDLSNPKVKTSTIIGDYYTDVAQAGTYLYILREFCESRQCSRIIRVVDVSDPENPLYVQTNANGSGSGTGRQFTVLNGIIYQSTNYGLEILDASSPGNWLMIGETNLIGPVLDVSVLEDYAFMVDAKQMHIIDVRNQSNFFEVSSFLNNANSSPIEVEIDNNFAYLNLWTGFQIVDLSDVFHPQELGSIISSDESGSNGIFDIAVLDGYLYAVMEDQNLRVIDVTKPNQPQMTSSIPLQGFGYGQIALLNENGYLVSGGCNEAECLGSLQIINVTDPFAPNLVMTLNIPGAKDVVLNDQYAYIISDLCYYTYSSCSSQVLVLDIANPMQPHQVGDLTIPGSYSKIAIGDKFATLGGDKGIALININNPFEPYLIGIYETKGRVLNMTLSSNDIYIAAENEGLLILKFDESQ